MADRPLPFDQSLNPPRPTMGPGRSSHAHIELPDRNISAGYNNLHNSQVKNRRNNVELIIRNPLGMWPVNYLTTLDVPKWSS